jgi:uncharacterized membrane protein YfcA
VEPAGGGERKMTMLQDLLAIASGGLVGFTLGLVGGGGSILAVPLLILAFAGIVIAVGLYVIVKSMTGT